MAHEPENPYRLSNDVLPQAYRLVLAPDLKNATFAGTVEIDLSIAHAVDAVVLNAVELTIADAALVRHDGTTSACSVTFDLETERAIFTTGSLIEPGNAVLRMTFEGILNDQLVGFYRSTFVDPDGVTQTIATSQMEATDARRAFPCFDEPSKKATFTITLIVPEHLAAYSNSPVVSEERPGDGTRVVAFAPTMVMSTYLVAFVVGPFEETAAIDVDGVPVRIIYPPGKGDLAPFALEVAAHSLRYFTNYFNIPYPGDKLDLVAIPDFAFGAMENLGCVTFRETALLVDPATASRNEVERVVDVIAHEIAHMWFGDLVTMGWWEGIWLNEAFATFMEIKCTDAFRPAWHRWVSFGIEREMAMATDGLHTTRPIEFDVISPADARGMFDILTYQKGGSVLRMLEQFLGEETFRDGIRSYLQIHAYGNTVTGDLWDALESVSVHPVRTIMDTWILQGGHPVVTVEDGTVSQTSFAYGEASGESAIGDTWLVPLMTRPLGSEAVTTDILGRDQKAIAANTVVNAGGWGVYRTSYGRQELATIAQHLDQLDALERATLVADTWAATLAGHRTLSDFLTLANGLGGEIEPATWTVVAGALGTVSRFVSDEDRPLLEQVTKKLFTGLFGALGWEAADGEDEQAPTLRSIALSSLGTIGADESIRSEALTRFHNGHVQGDVADAIVAIVGDVASEQDFDECLRRYHDAPDPQSEQRYLFGLTAFTSADLSERAFALSCSDEVRSQDAPYVVSALLANRLGGPSVFEELAKNWADCLARFTNDAHSRMLSGVARMISSPITSERVTTFLAEHPIHSGQRTVDQAIERMWVGVTFAERERPQLRRTLEGFLATS
jgi:puromycin-sensitive aminopeptidase